MASRRDVSLIQLPTNSPKALNFLSASLLLSFSFSARDSGFPKGYTELVHGLNFVRRFIPLMPTAPAKEGRNHTSLPL